MTRARRRTRRAHLALAAVALWLVGVEALPAVHEALHARLAPHHHAGGSIVTASFEDSTHRHPDGSIHFVAPRARAKPRPDRPGVSDAAGHAAGLAHHAAAIAPAAPPVTTPLPIDRRPVTLAVASEVAWIALDPLAPSARGPPLVASAA
jgi:hypothetical protein